MSIERLFAECNNCSMPAARVADTGYDPGQPVPHPAPPLVATARAEAPPRPMPLTRRIIKPFLAAYLRLYHHLEIEGFEHLPPRGPLIVVVNHASLLDV